MKKTIAMLLALILLVAPIAFAEELTNETQTNEIITSTEDLSEAESQDITNTIQQSTETTKNVSVTPDMPLRWGLKTWSEKLSLLLTFNKFKKAEKKLEQAKERLQEMKQMSEKKNLKALAKAQKIHASLVAELAEVEETLANDNLTAAEKVDFELQKHIQILEGVQAKLQAKGVPTQGVDNALVKSRKALEKFQNMNETRKAKLSEKVINKVEKISEKVKGKVEKLGDKIEEKETKIENKTENIEEESSDAEEVENDEESEDTNKTEE